MDLEVLGGEVDVAIVREVALGGREDCVALVLLGRWWNRQWLTLRPRSIRGHACGAKD